MSEPFHSLHSKVRPGEKTVQTIDRSVATVTAGPPETVAQSEEEIKTNNKNNKVVCDDYEYCGVLLS